MKKIIYLFAILWAITSCEEHEVAPTFAVIPSAVTVQAGDTVTFDIKSDAGFVSFYSGEFGNEYAFANGRIVAAQGLDMFFQSRVANGSQANQLSVWASTDFNNTYDVPSVKAATWVNITDRFLLGVTNNVYRDSGTKDISDLVQAGKPLYLAYKYVGKPQTANGGARTWTITNFSLKSMTEGGPQTIADQASASWKIVEDGEIVDPGRSSVNSSGTITLRGNNVNTNVQTEVWAISRGIAAGDINMGPDKSIPVKNMAANNLTQYTYIYTKPGEYKATFVALNETVYGKKELIKEVTITVNP